VPELALTMPKMSMTMEEGTMVAWLKQPGEAVRAGEPVCEVATDKVDMEVESPFDGVLARIVAEVGEVLPVGETIAFVTTEADDLLGGLFDEPSAPVAEAPVEERADAAPASTAPAGPVDVPAVPAARELARARGVDLAAVAPTGAWGAVRVQDVEAAGPDATAALAASGSAGSAPAEVAAADAPAPVEPVGVAPMSGGRPSADAATTGPASPVGVPRPAADPALARRNRIRKQIAKVMDRSAVVPQFTAWIDLDLSRLAPIRKTDLGGASWTAILLRAQALALSATPALLGHWTDDGVAGDAGVGVALAIDSPNGLIAPVVRDPHLGSLAEVSERIRSLVAAARDGALGPDDLAGGTTVFSNLGGLGVDRFTALITPPHATALSAGAVAQKLHISEAGAMSPRLGCTVGLTVDHRVADGADAARMLQELTAVIADPARLR